MNSIVQPVVPMSWPLQQAFRYPKLAHPLWLVAESPTSLTLQLEEGFRHSPCASRLCVQLLLLDPLCHLCLDLCRDHGLHGLPRSCLGHRERLCYGLKIHPVLWREGLWPLT